MAGGSSTPRRSPDGLLWGQVPGSSTDRHLVMGTVRGIYEKLELSGFSAIEPAIDRYLGSLRSYRKNEHPPLPPGLRERIAQSWRRTFEEWGYQV